MDQEYIKDILTALEAGEITSEKAMEMLRDLPYKSLGFANVDHHRTIRTGFPEVIYCQGKTPEQIRDIFLELSGYEHSAIATGARAIATRATEKDYKVVVERIPEAIFHREAGIIEVPAPADKGKADENDICQVPHGHDDPGTMGTVAVVTAGTADIPIAEEAAVTAELFGNDVIRIYDVGVAGIHRLFDNLEDIKKADVIIVVAGMEGALASVIGGLVDIPVIAVPTSVGYGSNFEGLSALLSMLNSCANGVTVVNIDNGFGAAYAASVINSRQHRHFG